MGFYLLMASYVCFPLVLILCFRGLNDYQGAADREIKNLRKLVVFLVVSVMSLALGLIGAKYQFDNLAKKIDTLQISMIEISAER